MARTGPELARARERLGATGRRSILFLDEIHRFNKAQQDALLSHEAVERGRSQALGERSARLETPSGGLVEEIGHPRSMLPVVSGAARPVAW